MAVIEGLQGSDWRISVAHGRAGKRGTVQVLSMQRGWVEEKAKGLGRGKGLRGCRFIALLPFGP